MPDVGFIRICFVRAQKEFLRSLLWGCLAIPASHSENVKVCRETSRRRNESGKTGRSSAFVVCDAACWRAEPHAIHIVLCVPHRRGAWCEPRQEKGHSHGNHHVHTRYACVRHTTRALTCEPVDEADVTLCVCQNKNKRSRVTTHRAATVTSFPPRDALTAACHYTSKRVLPPLFASSSRDDHENS